jgi:hypothetical protein
MVMNISLLHAGLAAGAALAIVPVILHLFMKQTPKHVIFPALRLIRERQKRSRKRLRIRNWLLLLARMALVALMALALARPSLFSQTTLGDREVPTALGLVFDTSLSMGYKQRDKTRLDEAKERAHEILRKTPDTSQVFVVDSFEPGVPPPLSPAAARKRIDGLTIHPANRPLNAAMGQVYTAIADSDRPRHEVYVLTDLARSSWDTDRPAEGLDQVKKVKTGVSTYVLRLTPKDAHDVAVVEAEPAARVATEGEPVEIRAKVRSQGPATRRVVELYLDGVKKGQKPLDLPANGEAEVRFTTPKLDPAALHQGDVRIGGAPDPLAFDDKRTFTFKVQPALKVLVVADRDIDGEFIKDALDPDPAALPPGTPRIFRVERLRSVQWAGRTDALGGYSCVILNNVDALGEADWGRLNAYVRDGGGLILGLGDRTEPENYNGASAATLLPGRLGSFPKPKSEVYFGKVTDFTHPLFSRFSRELDDVLSKIPVYRHWPIAVAPPDGTRTLLSYTDNEPALIERTFQGARTGHVLLWTTPLSRRADRQSPAAWNELPQFWPFLVVLHQAVPYLAGAAHERPNYEAGENAVLPIDPSRQFKHYVFAGGEAKTTETLSPPVSGDALEIVAPPLGHWTVTATGPEGAKAIMGFSVNPPLAETRLTPLQTRDLDALFGGTDRYELADDPESLKRAVGLKRIGQEIFPWLMALILVLVTAENVLANRFYRATSPRPASGEAGRRTMAGVAT